jgi:hypothetical protein
MPFSSSFRGFVLVNSWVAKPDKFDPVAISEARLAFYAGRASSAYGIYE